MSYYTDFFHEGYALKNTRFSRFAICVVVAALGSARAATPELGSPDFYASPEHPFGWRGDGSGRFVGATPATSWSEKQNKNVRWSVVVGNGFSSPILTEKSVLVTSEPNVLACVSRADGIVQWKLEIKPDVLADEKSRKASAEYEPPKDGSGMMAATPATDGKWVYVLLANGIVRAVDLESKGQWSAYIDAEQTTGYGRSASPILANGKLFVSMSNLYAFDAATGKQVWMNPDAPSTYGSVVPTRLGDVNVLVTSNGELGRANDGKIIAAEIGHMLHPTPVISEGMAFFAENTPSGVKLNVTGKSPEIWTASLVGDIFCSPLVHDGLLFTVTAKGELFAFDTKGKGEQMAVIDARPLLGETESNSPLVYSSLTLAGKNLFLTANQGEVLVLEATREAKLVTKNSMMAGSGA